MTDTERAVAEELLHEILLRLQRPIEEFMATPNYSEWKTNGDVDAAIARYRYFMEGVSFRVAAERGEATGIAAAVRRATATKKK